MAGSNTDRRAASPYSEGVWPRVASPQLVADNAAPLLQLSRIVECEIIPRLMLLHSSPRPVSERARQGFAITAAHVETLTRLAVEDQSEPARAFVDGLITSGARQEDVFLQLLSPAAELMGRLWLDDVYSFSQVTLGLWRLQQIFHEQSERFRRLGRAEEKHRVLLATEPGSQHTFGVSMLGEFFSRDGWAVDLQLQAGWDELEQSLSTGWYDVLGLSIGMDAAIPAVASAILRLRDASCNRQLYVMVGGPVAQSWPDLAQRCGADAMATEALAAVSVANQWLGLTRRVRE